MRSRWLGFVITAVLAAGSTWAYPRLPPAIPTHWNLRGEPIGYTSRLVAVIVLPATIGTLTGLLQLLPTVGTDRLAYTRFADVHRSIVNAALLFLAAVHVAVIGNGSGAPIGPADLVPFGVGILLIFIGGLLRLVPPNTALGIRTPWALASERVWRRTHETAGRSSVAGGLVVIVSGVIPRVGGLAVVLLTVALVVLIPVVHSYLLRAKERSVERP